VGKASAKPIIGILGGVCSGKSTVAAEFAKLGCIVIDADKIAHELLERNDIREKIVAFFGEAILGSAGKIDHRKLADIVFADASKLSSLNEIIHPLVLEQAEELIRQYNRQNQVKVIVLHGSGHFTLTVSITEPAWLGSSVPIFQTIVLQLRISLGSGSDEIYFTSSGR